MEYSRQAAYGLFLSLLVFSLAACDRTTPEEHLAAARGHEAAAEWQAAVIEYKNALQKAPELAAGRLGLGLLYERLGEAASAVKELERARALGAAEDALRLPLLRARVATGELEEAEAVIAEVEAVPAAEWSPELRAVLGRAQLRAGRPAEARALLEQAVADDPSLLQAHLALAQLALAEGDRDGAVLHARVATEANPEAPEAWLLLGELQLTAGDAAAAEAAFDRAAAVTEEDAVAARLGKARALLAQGELDAARPLVAAARKAQPANPIANYLQALLAVEDGALPEASAALERVFQRLPDHLPSRYLRALVAFREDRGEQALDDLERVLARDPGNPRARLLLAAVRTRLGEPGAAADTLEAGRTAAPEDTRTPGYLAALGQALLRAGRSQDALEAMAEAAELAPDAARIRTQLALTQLAAGETGAAEVELQTAVDLSDSFPLSDSLLVMVQIQSGRTDEALVSADAFVERDPENPLAWNMLGAARLAAGDRDEARRAFEQAVALEPAFKPARFNLASLARSEGDFEAARTQLQAVLDVLPADVTALERLADLTVAAGDPLPPVLDQLRGARRSAEGAAPRLALLEARLLRRLGRTEEAWSLLAGLGDAGLPASVRTFRAELARATGRVDEALRDYDALAASGSEDSELAVRLASLRMEQGDDAGARRAITPLLQSLEDPPAPLVAVDAELRIRARQYDLARERLRVLAALPGGEGYAAVLGGDLAAAEGDPAAAAEAYARGQRLLPDVRVMRKRYDALRAAGRDGEAREVLVRWLAEQPEDTAARLLLAEHDLGRGDLEGAIDSYETLRAARPDNPAVLNNLAWLYGETGRSGAVELAERARTLAPDSPAILDTLGWLLVQAGDAAAGLPHLLRAAEGSGGDPEIRYHLAVAQARTGDRAGARSSVRAALERGSFPGEPEARRLLAELDGG